MWVKSIEVSNFRNYGHLELDFDQGINIFYGMNAQGKTNLLEAVYLCSTTKSHRVTRDREMIRFGEDESHIKMYVMRNEVPYRIDMHLKKQKRKGIAINGIPIRKASELFGIVNVVFFSPEDLNIIKNGPSERRKFLDLEICQLDKLYVHDLIQYNKAILQCNNLLKELPFHREYQDVLPILEEQIVQYGTPLIRIRREFLQELSGIVQEIHAKLTDGREQLELIYEPHVTEAEFAEKLQAARSRDEKLKSTTVGPHRDDICFEANGMDIRKYGSQGQQRTAALSLKLAEIELVRKRIGQSPVLLLDDVLSELDSSRQNQLLDSLQDVQTMITCTGLDDFVRHRFHIDSVFEVQDGCIEKKRGIQ